ncbi:MAG: hypothetical protein NT162_00760 [Candidatus Woesebacteria bacterium]|nr:hypothetical protein [Candidatus Woesebacteria bacterium]
MKYTKTKIILSAIIFLSVAGFVGTVIAAGSSLYVSPTSLTKTIGDTFSVSVGVNASGSKVCAVEGTLVFNNLSCQNITVAGDVTPQSSPTCSSPYFLIGVPNCTMVDNALFTVSAKAKNAGIATISFTGVDIIGEGVSVGSASISGSYTINTVSASTPTLAPTQTPTPKTTPTPTPTQTPIQIPIVTTSKTEQQPTGIPLGTSAVENPNLFLATIGSFITLGTGNNIIGIIILFAIALIIYLAYSYFVRKKKPGQ